MELDAISLILLALAIPASFIVSAAAGLGGSLILVPAMMMAIGTKEGIAVAALLLACNNVAKVTVYRKTLPWRASGAVIIAVLLGTALGATLMLKLPEFIGGDGVFAQDALSGVCPVLRVHRNIGIFLAEGFRKGAFRSKPDLLQ